MRYIQKLVLENFQSHKYSEIEFDSYLNVIVGPSDQGKSAIIRALKWVLFNEPTGDFFIRKGENKCSVTVIFNDGIKLIRFRSKTKNTYYMYDKSGEAMVFEGFGTSVPQEIKDITSIRKIELDSNQSNSINISEQLEGPFLLSEKNSTKANAIGRIVGVHVVDDALKEALKDMRNLNMKEKNHKDVLKKLESDLCEYNYLNELVEKCNRLREIRNVIYDHEAKLKKLKEYFNNLNTINRDIRVESKYLEALNNIHKIAKIKENLKENIQKYTYINRIYITLINIQIKAQKSNNILSSLKGIYKLDTITKRIGDLYAKLALLDRLRLKYTRISYKININKTILLKSKSIDRISNNTKLLEDNLLQLAQLSNLKIKLDQINKNLSVGSVYLNRLSKTYPVFELIKILDVEINLLKRLMVYSSNSDYVVKTQLEIKNKLKNIDKEIEDLLNQYRIILNEIKVCPICFGSINKLKVDEIINSYR